MLKGFCDNMNVFKGSLYRLQTLQQSSTSINCSTRARITRARTFPRQIFQKGLNFKEIELLLSKVLCEKNFKNLKLSGRVVVYFFFHFPQYFTIMCLPHGEVFQQSFFERLCSQLQMSFEWGKFQARARVQNKSGIIALKNALHFVFPIPN